MKLVRSFEAAMLAIGNRQDCKLPRVSEISDEDVSFLVDLTVKKGGHVFTNEMAQILEFYPSRADTGTTASL